MEQQEALRSSGEHVQTMDELKNWLRTDVRRVLPHDFLGIGHGRVHGGGLAQDYVIVVDLPLSYIAAMRNTSGGLDTPLMRRWLTYREPQLFDASAPPDWPEINPVWLQQFRDYGLRNALVNSVVDTEQCLYTYFSFLSLPKPPGAKECDLMQMIIPIAHQVVVRVIQNIERQERELQPAWDRLTRRELEILGCVGSGKSNFEIAKTLDVSENTVKHHLSSIFEKTSLSSRSELITAFVKHPPGLMFKGVKAF
jgi:DNA-binding CsgD family transcriptional regulator